MAKSKIVSPESIVELSICNFLTMKGCFVQKTPRSGYYHHKLKRFIKDRNPYSRSGFPDLYVNQKGLGWHLEIKKLGGSLQESQKELLPMMRQKDCLVFVASTLTEVEKIYSMLEPVAQKLNLRHQLENWVFSTGIKDLKVPGKINNIQHL
jgi:hypothetical protein